MASTQTNPIDIPSRNSASPQQSDTHLKIGEQSSGRMDGVASQGTPMSYTPVPGAVPITSSRVGRRRESLAGGNSMTGISWGPGSISSWIGKDDLAMQGTSPYIGFEDLKSPDFHSSYVPRLEEQYMTGFKCCDIVLDSMHDLLRHFEEKHAGESAFAQALPQSSPNVDSQMRKHALSPPSQAAAQRPGPGLSRAQQATPSVQAPKPAPQQPQQKQTATAPVPTMADLDALEELDMDDLMNGANADLALPTGLNGFGTQNPYSIPARTTGTTTTRGNAPSLSVNPTTQFNFQNIRSQPTTPLSASRGLFNPTVSSVNTPSLISNPLQQLRDSPGSSMPGTPGEVDPDVLAQFGDMGFDTINFYPNNPSQAYNFQTMGFAGQDGECIDDPGKRLTSPGGPTRPANDTQDGVHQKLGNTQYGPDSDTAKTIRQRQSEAGMPDSDQPFLCPVIGCMKAYKNSNGLRYHKQHGHKDQALKDNGDGTYSIVDPAGNPYPGTEGMARAKPYACKQCGRRYKNANGLKYHYAHSEPCMAAGGQHNISENANIAGAGLVGQSDV